MSNWKESLCAIVWGNGVIDGTICSDLNGKWGIMTLSLKLPTCLNWRNTCRSLCYEKGRDYILKMRREQINVLTKENEDSHKQVF